MQRIIALDIGSVRIGVAVSDPLGFFAQGVAVLDAKGCWLSDLAKIAGEYEKPKLLIGMPRRTDGSEEPKSAPTTIPHNVTELLDQLIEQAIALVGKPVALMNKDDKVTVVQYLNNAGAFLITKSGDKVSSLLGISKFTLYSYMDAGK